MSTEPRAAIAQRLADLARQYGVPQPGADAIDGFCALAATETFAAGDVVFRQGDPADRALFVVSGRLRATLQVGDGAGSEQRLLGDSVAGDVVGETAVFVNGGRRTATLTAALATTCLVLKRELFLASGHNAAVIAMEGHLMRLLVGRIVDTDALLLRIWNDASTGKTELRQGLSHLLGAPSA